MTDAEHAQAIRAAKTAFFKTINAARLAGLDVEITFNLNDVCGSGAERGIRDFFSQTVVTRKL